MAGYLGIPRDEMMRRMGPREFLTWQVIDAEFEPFGEWRADVRAGMVAAPVVHLLKVLAFGKDNEPPKPSDFILKMRRLATAAKGGIKQTQAEIKSVFMALAAAAAKNAKP